MFCAPPSMILMDIDLEAAQVCPGRGSAFSFFSVTLL